MANGFFNLYLRMTLLLARRRVTALREQSRLMLAVITLFVVGYWGTSYLLFHHGFRFLGNMPGVGTLVVERMLYVFFAFLFVMLIFSNMIIGYAALYKSPEMQWMLTLPVPVNRVYLWKMLETALLASWAFLFLSAPMIVAYGWSRHVGVMFYVLVFVLFLPFTLVSAGAGSLIVLGVARYLPRRIFKLLLFGVGAALMVTFGILVRPVSAADLQETQMINALDQVLRNSNFCRHPLLPSSWVVQSMVAWGDGWAGRGSFFFLVVLSNGLMAAMISVVASGRLFYDGWSRSQSQGTLAAGLGILGDKIPWPKSGFLDSFIERIPGLDPCNRALIVKDVRIFWRDTSQWSQFVIFFGLLGLYVVNLRHISYDWQNKYYAVFIAFLNLGASSMTLGTLTARFVFPQFSLEGKRLWIIGMVPDGLRRIVLQKFWMSSAVASLIIITLTTLSCWMLHVPPWLTLLFAATSVFMSFALCGIAVGIGALIPNFRTSSTANPADDNPAKIVSGFGGTFCFVLSLVYITLVIAAESVGMWWQVGSAHRAEYEPWLMIGAWVFVALLSLVATTVPMHLALKRVETMEV